MRAKFPLFIDITDKTVIIFGAGSVAVRRARALIGFGARIRVVAPVISDEMAELEKNSPLLSVERREYRPGELKDEFMALAATSDSGINAKIAAEARGKHILVNNASDRADSDFYFPALAKSGDIVVGICGNGEDKAEVAAAAERVREVLKP